MHKIQHTYIDGKCSEREREFDLLKIHFKTAFYCNKKQFRSSIGFKYAKYPMNRQFLHAIFFGKTKYLYFASFITQLLSSLSRSALLFFLSVPHSVLLYAILLFSILLQLFISYPTPAISFLSCSSLPFRRVYPSIPCIYPDTPSNVSKENSF